MPSTVIERFSYDDQTRTLFVTFTSGELYAYLDVPPRVPADLRAAFSKGRYFSRHIRDHFRYERLGPGGAPPDTAPVTVH